MIKFALKVEIILRCLRKLEHLRLNRNCLYILKDTFLPQAYYISTIVVHFVENITHEF